MKNYYAVKRGKTPGIYTDWIECEKQIKGFSNAKFKKFATEELAQEYLNETEELTFVYPKVGLAVDASLLRKKGYGEYQIYDINTRKIIFKSRLYYDTTVNIMEFLAITKALELSKDEEEYFNVDIYSDSATAIAWTYNKEINTNNIPDEETQKEILEAILLLKNNSFANKLIKWDTNRLGDIPADFGRK